MSQMAPSIWAKNFVRLGRSRPFKFKGRRWAIDMLDHHGPGTVVWMCSRQVGKSTLSQVISDYYCVNYDDFISLYVCPEQDQAFKFSRQRIDPIRKSSPIIEAMMGEIDNMSEKSFANGAYLYLKWAKHNPDSARGITADLVRYDEGQDLALTDIRPIIEESQFVARKLRLIGGTPKSIDNDLQVHYEATDQREWLVWCRNHSPKKAILLGQKNIGKHGPACHHCGRALDVDDGVWVAMSPNPPDVDPLNKKPPGFRIHQLQCGDSHYSADNWLAYRQKIKDYELKGQTNIMLNEVFGRSVDSAEDGITQAMVRNACTNERLRNLPIGADSSYLRFAGIDWGHGTADTTLAIGGFVKGAFKVVGVWVWSGNDTQDDICVPQIAKILGQWGVIRVHCDYGGGFGLSSKLQRMVSKFDCHVTSNLWTDALLANESVWDDNKKPPLLKCNKTAAFTDGINALVNREILLPSFEDMIHHVHYFRAVKIERDRFDNIRYVKASGKNDDLWHAILYARIIAQAHLGI